MLSNSVEFSTKKRVPAHSAGPKSFCSPWCTVHWFFRLKRVRRGTFYSRKIECFSLWPPLASPWPLFRLPWPLLGLPLASLGLSLASSWPPLASPWPPFGLPWPLLGLPLASLGLSLASLWPPLASPWPPFGVPWPPKAAKWSFQGSEREPKCAQSHPRTPPDTSQDVHWIENGAKMEVKCLRIR